MEINRIFVNSSISGFLLICYQEFTGRPSVDLSVGDLDASLGSCNVFRVCNAHVYLPTQIFCLSITNPLGHSQVCPPIVLRHLEGKGHVPGYKAHSFISTTMKKEDIRLVSLSFNSFIPRLKQVPSFPSCPLVLISTPRKPFQQYRNTETTKCVTFMLVLQTNPVGLQLFSYVDTLFCFKKLT